MGGVKRYVRRQDRMMEIGDGYIFSDDRFVLSSDYDATLACLKELQEELKMSVETAIHFNDSLKRMVSANAAIQQRLTSIEQRHAKLVEASRAIRGAIKNTGSLEEMAVISTINWFDKILTPSKSGSKP